MSVVSIKNYVLTYIDSNNKEVIINSKGYEADLESKPFYVSMDNARKNKTKLQNLLKQDQFINRLKHWHDDSLSTNEGFRTNFQTQSIKAYKDLLKINENGLNIKEVTISVELN